MSLQEYRRKRNFRRTTEPTRSRASKGGPIFVVQEHHASHLHYDFRLEAFGTLKSWAVPKGPSTAPGDKRLAVEVEDHPISYASFHGRIPEGEYGAGVVKIWDKGVWVPPPHLKEMLAKGHLEFELKGKKLKGRWMLVRTKKGAAKPQWLLIKRSDVPAPTRTARERKKTAGEKAAFPTVAETSPQLAQLTETVPPGADWIFETKFDGYRTLVHKRNGRSLKFFTRSGLDWSARYAQLEGAFRKLKAKNFVIDGEIVSEDEKGRSSFSLLQESLESGAKTGLKFQAFDLLYLDGRDLRGEPLEVRKQILKDLLREAPAGKLRFSEHVRGQGEDALRAACRAGLEGIIAKDRGARYRAGRSDLWRKIKCTNRQEVVIGGFTDPRGSRAGLGALLVGVREAGALKYAGKVGTGFDDRLLRDLRARLESIGAPESPFKGGAPPRGAHWVKPRMVAEVEFTEWTRDGHMRHPVFVGLREDKSATEVVHERPVAAKERKKKRGAVPPAAAGFRITHPERVVYPADNFTKLDVANYYKSVAPWLLPHIADRPLALVRCPARAAAQCFFQKHVDIERMNELRETMIRDQKTVSTDSADGLLQLAQWGVLELHAWQNHNDSPERPDQFIIDLDPDEGVAFARVKETAFRMRALLRELDLESFVKVTGGKGLHVHVPIRPDYSWDQIKNFAKSLGQQLAEEHPGEYTTKMSKEGRKGKIFIDYLRNGFGATAVAPYSLRSKEHATVAVPVTWEELKAMRRLKVFSPKETLKRLASMKKEVWPGYFQRRQEIALLKTPSRRPRSSRSGAGR
ncbi:MAG: DNA ligase D [Bdellovibrionaceae bacterium]|nr:DNA ligase D [Pseudobdellovibrionaceae bacterium]